MTSISPDIDPATPVAGAAPSSGSFDDYPLSPALLAAVAERGMVTPTPIQATAIPALLSGRDVVGQARTGSGKTLAFSLPLLEAIDASRASVQALVLAPTRELASQVAAVIADLGTVKGVSVALLYGGTSSGPQRMALRRGAQVAVGTPGRILDLISQGALWLDQARFVVLDEADEMFDQGFAQDVERIMDKTSNSRQTALFSATMPEWVRQTAARYLYDPETIAVDGGEERASTVPHTAYVVPTRERPGSRAGYGRGRDDADMQAKLGALRDLLDHRGEGSAIVFGRTKQGVAALSKQLDRDGYPVGALQGNMTQAERDFVMGSFREGRIDVLVATNVAARGLDLVGVNLVINVELPESAELLTHRVGRTGRMGRGGQAITLLAGADLARWQLLTRDATFPIRQLPWEGAEAALALGDDEQADRAAGAAPASSHPGDQPTGTVPAPDDPDDQNDQDDLAALVEEAPTMDDPFTPEPFEDTRSAAEGRPARPAPSSPPTRRASRRAPESPAPPVRSSDDASDLIARALASVGAAAPAAPPPATRPATPPVRRSTPRPESTAARAPQQADPSRAVRPAATDVPAPAPVAPAPPVARPAVAASAAVTAPVDPVDPAAPPVPGPSRGTPRPGWVRGAAERVAHWHAGASSPGPGGTGTSHAPVSARSESALAEAAVPQATPTFAAPPTPVETPPARAVTPSAAPFGPERESAPAPMPVTVPDSEPVATAVTAATAAPDRPVAREGRPTTPPPVRRRSPAPPSEPVAATAFPGVSSASPAGAPAAGAPAAGVPAAARPEPPRIPTVRASRSRPAAVPTPEPAVIAPEPAVMHAPETVSPETPVAAPTPEPGEAAHATAGTMDVPSDLSLDTATTTDLDSDVDDAPSGEVAPAGEQSRMAEDAPDQSAGVAATSPAEVMEPDPPVVTPPARRRGRAGRAAESTAGAPEPTQPAGGEDAPEATPKPPRRASSRRAAADKETVTAVSEPVAPILAPVPADTVSNPGDGADGAPEPPPKASRRSGSGQGRAGKASAATAGDDVLAASDPVTDPDPAPPKGRGRAARPQPATTPEPPAPKSRGQGRSAGQSPAGGTARGRNAEQALPGNRRTPGPRSGTEGGRDAMLDAADDNRGNTTTPERGNTAQARGGRASAGYASSGPPPRRRPAAAPSSARCAACGTPHPKGYTRKYCPACERELAVRSQES